MKFPIIILAIAFLILSGSKSAFSQNTWSKRFGDINYTNSSVNGENCFAISHNDSGIVIIYGWVDNGFLYWRTRFMEISYQGNESYIKDYGETDEKWSGPFNGGGRKTLDGGFVYPLGVVPFNESNGVFPSLIRFNNVGDTIWMKRYFDASKFYSALNVIQCLDGGFAIVGVTTPDSLEYNPQIFVMKVDSMGNEIWIHEYGEPTTSTEYGTSIVETNNGFIIGGQKFNTNTSNPNPYLLAVDSLGNFLWHQIIGSSAYYEGVVNINSLNDGNFVCVAGLGAYLDDGDTYTQSHIRKINSEGDIIWENNIGNISENSYFLSSEVAADGSIFAQGMVRTNNPINQINSEVGTIAKFNSDGDSLWMREYSYTVEGASESPVLHILRDMDILANGDLVATGSVVVTINPDFPSEYSGQDIWVLKTDSMGCLVAGCDTVVGINELDEFTQQTWFTYGPNPVIDQVHIYITEIIVSLFKELRFELRNMEGKSVKEFYGKQNGGISYIMDVNYAKSGMYILTLYGDGKRLQSEKLIIQH